MVEAHGVTHAWRTGMPPPDSSGQSEPRDARPEPTLRRRWETACPQALRRLVRVTQSLATVPAERATEPIHLAALAALEGVPEEVALRL
eukprot:10822328-Alexandrium_andersonii.AAC.1